MQEQKPEIYFALKQLQTNFSKIYKVKQSDRFAILSQVKLLLDDGFPKYVIRTDIQDFYESISHEKLLKKVNEDSLLSFLSKRIIAQILKEYSQKAPSTQGLPRGVGISAYLAELYLRDLDKQVKAIPDVIYYARYVDDIIVVFTPPSLNSPQRYLQDLTSIINSHSLTVNATKTQEFDLRTKTQNANHSFDYLGYKFSFGFASYKPIQVQLNLATKKIDKYKNRIDISFSHYFHHSKVDEKTARKQLIKRIRFLVSNTRLKNNKKNILTGIYHSHSLLNTTQDLEHLDEHFQNSVNINNFPPKLADRLRANSFLDGFVKRKFVPFSTTDLHEIMKIWRKK